MTKRNLWKYGEYIKGLNLRGISLMTNTFSLVVELIRFMRDKFENIPIICCGVHPTLKPYECMKFADYVWGRVGYVFLDYRLFVIFIFIKGIIVYLILTNFLEVENFHFVWYYEII